MNKSMYFLIVCRNRERLLTLPILLLLSPTHPPPYLLFLDFFFLQNHMFNCKYIFKSSPDKGFHLFIQFFNLFILISKIMRCREAKIKKKSEHDILNRNHKDHQNVLRNEV